MNILNYFKHSTSLMMKNITSMSWYKFKPTGQGTGLGLSLAYDIVKAHGDELKVESEEGKGTTFTITIPN